MLTLNYTKTRINFNAKNEKIWTFYYTVSGPKEEVTDFLAYTPHAEDTNGDTVVWVRRRNHHYRPTYTLVYKDEQLRGKRGWKEA
jgi:hypothetical protein